MSRQLTDHKVNGLNEALDHGMKTATWVLVIFLTLPVVAIGVFWQMASLSFYVGNQAGKEFAAWLCKDGRP